MKHGNPTECDSQVVTLIDVLRQRASQFPSRVAFVYEDEAGTVDRWTYRELEQRSLAVGAWVAQHCEAGDRALLVFPSGLEFVAAFLGCMAAGVLPSG